MHRSLFHVATTSALMALFLGSLGAGEAAAQSVQGNGIVKRSHGAVDGANYFSKVTVNAWLDDEGVPQGMISWQGDFPQTLPPNTPANTGGPSDPYILEVTDLYVEGNTAWVGGIVIASTQGHANGGYASFVFIDNEGTADPDYLNYWPLDAGDYHVSE